MSAAAACTGCGLLLVTVFVLGVGWTDLQARRAVRDLGPRFPTTRTARGARLARLPVPAWVKPRLEEMGVALDPVTGWWSWVGAIVIAGTASEAAGGPGLAVLGMAVAVAAPLAWWLLWRHRAASGVESALPEALEELARGLRSGGSLRTALADTAGCRPGALGDDLRRVVTQTAAGVDVRAALARWGDARPLPGVRLAVAALSLGVEAGGPQALAVDGVASTLRQRSAAAAEARALAAQARISALVIAAAPLAFSVLASGTDSRTARFVLHTTTGQLLLGLGLLLDGAGAVWMAHLTRSDR